MEQNVFKTKNLRRELRTENREFFNNLVCPAEKRPTSTINVTFIRSVIKQIYIANNVCFRY